MSNAPGVVVGHVSLAGHALRGLVSRLHRISASYGDGELVGADVLGTCSLISIKLR